jgi:hypothetical protein
LEAERIGPPGILTRHNATHLAHSVVCPESKINSQQNLPRLLHGATGRVFALPLRFSCYK